MFDDARSKKLVILSHCLLNQNSISDGTADCPSQFTEIIGLLMENGIGMLQLPCPEVVCLGLDRMDREGGKRPVLQENARIRALMSRDGSMAALREKVTETVGQVQEYRSCGFKVIGVIGINRSPSCGVETTTRNNHEERGTGVFMGLLSEAFAARGQTMRMIGVKTSDKEESIEKVRELLRARSGS